MRGELSSCSETFVIQSKVPRENREAFAPLVMKTLTPPWRRRRNVANAFSFSTSRGDDSVPGRLPFTRLMS